MSDKSETTIVEINGIKMEIDLRKARIVHDNIRVGSKVKILVTGYSEPMVHAGVVIGFDDFEKLPTINVAYIVGGYWLTDMQFAAINDKSSEKYSIVPALDDELPINRATVLESFDRMRVKAEREIQDLEQKRAYFERMFGQYFEKADATAELP